MSGTETKGIQPDWKGPEINGAVKNRKDLIMQNLDLTEAKVKNLENLEDVAIRTLTQALEGEREVDDRVQLAMKTANMVTNNRVHAGAREAMRFSMVQVISTDEQIKRYVAVTYPRVQKVLTGDTKKKSN